MFVNQILASFSSLWPAVTVFTFKRIVNIMKTCVHQKEQHTSEINTIPLKNSDFIDFGKFEVRIYFRDQRAHCYSLRVATGSGGAGRFGT